MKYLTLNNDKAMKLSKISMGTGRFGTRVNEELAFNLMNLYVERGGNLIDTARSYSEWVENGRGISERVIGKWLKTVDRSKVHICTKCGMNRIHGEQIIDLSRKQVENEFNESLHDLDTDYIDIFLLHRDEPERPVEEIVETMQKIYETQKVKAIGVANWDISRIKKANNYAVSHNLKPFSVVQTWWSLAEYTESMWNDSTTTNMNIETEKYLFDNKDILAMGYTSQCRGFFSKAIKEGLENIDDFLKSRIVTEANLKKLAYIKNLCDLKGYSPEEVVLGYILNNEINNGIAMVSCSSIEQLNSVLDASDSELSIEDIKVLDSIK